MTEESTVTKTNGKRKLITKRRVIFLILLVVAFFIGQAIYNRNLITADVTTVTRGDITESISASGEVTASKKALLTFQTMGKLISINANEGDFVAEGQLIASLDTTNLYQAYLSAEANLRAAEATLAKTYDTVQGHTSDESFSQREARTAAEAAKDVAFRSFVQAKHNLDSARIVSPFAGILVDITDGIAEGINVTPATATFAVIDPSTVYFSADVNEIDVSKLSGNQEVQLTLDAFPDTELKESVVDISFASTTTSSGGTAFPVKITLPVNSNNKYRLGMNGDAEFVLSREEDVILVPGTAVVEDGDKEYVWIVDNGKAKRVEVKTGSTSLDFVEITDGVTENQSILVKPPKEIREGVRVRTKKV